MVFSELNQFRHIFVISGPSGVGKASVMEAIIQNTDVVKLATYATRPKRRNERDGFDYRFISTNEFKQLVNEGEIVEHVQVYGDHFYGSPRLLYSSSGPDILIELDTEGRRRYAKAYSPHITSIFLLPPSIIELRRRIESRQHEKNLERRLSAAVEQLGCANEYDYLVINDDLNTARQSVLAILHATQLRLSRESSISFAASLKQQWGVKKT